MENAILFGNGLNLLNDPDKTWDNLLKQIACNYHTELINGVSNTLKYESIYLSNVIKHVKEHESYKDSTEYNLKQKIAQSFLSYNSNWAYKELLQLPVTHFMTTNYDHALDMTCSECEYKYNKGNSDYSEKIYSIRRKRTFVGNSFNDNKYEWMLHGDIDNLRSIMLGYDHYCGYIAKMNEYIKGHYKYPIINIENMAERIINNDPLRFWIDLFFMSDVHIFALKLDFDEIDIWWLLNKRIRMQKEGKAPIKNHIHYYDYPVDTNKKELMQKFGVEVHEYKDVQKDDYTTLYQKILQDIRSYIENN